MATAIEVGKALPNGALVLAFNNTANTILALWHTEFVTWRVDAQGNAFWGHYFQIDSEGAWEDYKHRCTAA